MFFQLFSAIKVKLVDEIMQGAYMSSTKITINRDFNLISNS